MDSDESDLGMVFSSDSEIRMDSDQGDAPVQEVDRVSAETAPAMQPAVPRRSPAPRPKSILKKSPAAADHTHMPPQPPPKPPTAFSQAGVDYSSDDDLSSLESDYSDNGDVWHDRGDSWSTAVAEAGTEPDSGLKPYEIEGAGDEVEAATTKIQASVRGKQARRQRANEVDAATRIQAVHRGRSSRREREAGSPVSEGAGDEVEAATTKIQASVRGRQARRQRANEVDAATRIQAVHRGRSSRRDIGVSDTSSQLAEITRKYEAEKALREAMERQLRQILLNREQNKKQEDAAATRLQASWRGKTARNSVTKERSAAVHIQSTFRGRMVRNRGGSAAPDDGVSPRKIKEKHTSRSYISGTSFRNAAQSQATALVLGGAAAAAAAAAGASRPAVAVAAGSAAANTLIALGGSAVAAVEAAVKAATNAGGSPADVAHIAGLAAGNAAIAARVSPSAAASAAAAACHAQQSSAALPAVVAGAIAGKAATLRGAKPKRAGEFGSLAARTAGASQVEIAEVTWLTTVAAEQWRAAGQSSVTDRTAALQQQQHIQRQMQGQGGGLETKLHALEAELAATGGRGTTTGEGRRLAKHIKALKRRLEQHTRLTTPRLTGPSAADKSAVAPRKEAAAIFAAALVFAPIPSGSNTVDMLSAPRSRPSTAARIRAPPSSSGKMKTRPVRPGRRLVSKQSAGQVNGIGHNQQLTRPRSAPAKAQNPHTPRTPRPYHGAIPATVGAYNPLQARGPAGAGGLIVRAPAPAVLAEAHLDVIGQDDVHVSARVSHPTNKGKRGGRSSANRTRRVAKSGTGGYASALLQSDAWSRG